MPDENDGGYYAIKGFLYQFDKALIEIILNPNTHIGIEQRQDIDYLDFVIQVKHKETQEYKEYKIKKPIIQLIDMFSEDQTQKFCLYCYFKDKERCQRRLGLTELNKILGEKADSYTKILKEKFIESFYIHFSDNFEDQFSKLISLIRTYFSLPSNESAYFYHSLMRSRLLDISLKLKGTREISRSDLGQFIHGAERTVFYTAYSKYLDKDKYERLVKKEFFTFKSPNIENFERLFVIDCDDKVLMVELNKLVRTLINKYYKIYKSPQPFICFKNLEDQRLIDLKQNLLDQEIIFNDGTYFDGDRFRLERIIKKSLDSNNPQIKIINQEYLDRLVGNLKFEEIYQFYLTVPIELETECIHAKVQITETRQILRMLS